MPEQVLPPDPYFIADGHICGNGHRYALAAFNDELFLGFVNLVYAKGYIDGHAAAADRALDAIRKSLDGARAILNEVAP